MTVDFGRYRQAVAKPRSITSIGRVSRVIGLVIEGDGPDVPIGSMCRILPRYVGEPIEAEVVGFRNGRILMMPLSAPQGISPSCRIESVQTRASIMVDDSIMGRVLDGLGRPLDGLGKLNCKTEMPLYAQPVNPVLRKRITEPMDLGIRAVNSLLTCGRGQRMGILSGTGIGKSVMLGMMARYTDADVTVIGFVGERGREVKEFMEKNLGPNGRERSVVVTATSDNTPLVRLRSAYTATAIAEYFRARGKNVLLMLDSLTRFAMAQREISLSIGEPPATKGYTPSVFALLPRLLERAGTGTENEGSITGLYTILVEGDDLSDPIADASRAILDGHIILSRQLASKGHYPAVDVLNSISRVMIDVTSSEHMELAAKLRKTYAVYKEAEDLISVGAYVKGSNPDIDYAVSKIKDINRFLVQDISQKCGLPSAVEQLKRIF
ncbi:MAG: flagellum-specific ATP synthase FliI [bacterium]|nr:MAG: flagellum-specific ATP synthase FliI [bacterium]